MNQPNNAGKAGRARRREQAILFSVGPYAFAIAADAVQEICSTHNVAGTASAVDLPGLSKVKHTLRRRNRTYYVVNACIHFHIKPSRSSLALILRQSSVAVLVDGIERMSEVAGIHPLPRAFRGEERHWYRGLVKVDDQVVPVVNPAAFLSDQELCLLEGAPAASPEERSKDAGAVTA